MPDAVEDDDIYVMNEFIFIHYRNSLRPTKPKMPDKACSNGL